MKEPLHLKNALHVTTLRHTLKLKHTIINKTEKYYNHVEQLVVVFFYPYISLKYSFEALHMGHKKSSGKSSNGVPGGMSIDGSPNSGS